MPQINIGSTNIVSFGFSVNVDIYGRTMLFDTSTLTVYNTGGAANVLGIAFSLVDSVGVALMSVDWTSPQIIPSVSQTYTLDLTSLPINFLFQNYQFIGYIKDQDGTVYATQPIIKTICEPPNIVSSGYVPGTFQILPDCINNILTVKELTLLVYNNQTPESTTKTGTLYYPTGTISAVTFTGTPFSNNVVYTGQYQISCTTVATYDLQDDIYVLVSYVTNQQFPVVCANAIGDITCCLTKVYNTYLANCENAQGEYALQQYNATLLPFSLALAKQINGQDASAEVSQIKKMLNCDCGSGSVGQNEITPVNPAVNSIVLQGAGGTTIPDATITGNTKTYTIASNSYVVAKGDTGDLAYTITIDTSVQYVVTYKITFNYNAMAGYILTAIAADPTLVNQLNSLITATGVNLSGLSGSCIIDLSQSNYSVSQSVTGSTLITNIVINGTNYSAPSNLYATDIVSVANWLNSLTLGTFTAVVSSGTLTIQSVNNPNTLSTITFTTPDVTKMFSATNATLVQVLQAIINYLCNLTALQVTLANNLNLCTFDYNGNIVTTTYPATLKQNDFNAGVSSSICNIVSRINTLTGLTCAALKAIFIDNTTGQFDGGTARVYGIDQNGNCVGFTLQQIGLGVMNSVSLYSDVKDAFCAIDCSVAPTCPEVSGINMNVVTGNIGIYGVTWGTATTASQTVTVKYRVTGNTTWYISTNSLLILPNGNVSGTSPYQITGLTAGTSYDVFIQNNCGGTGFISSITTPTGSVYTGSYLVDTILYDLCGDSPTTLYTSSPFAIGVIMYTDIGLTTPLTGYTYITASGYNIYTIDSGTGQVLADTGSACTSGTAGTYTLGNDTATICSGSSTTLYTNGAFAVGKILYTDSALSNPQTGYSYVVNNGGTIYNVNSTTGAIGSSTGLSCLNYILSAAYNFSINSVTGTGVPTLPATGVNGSQSGHHTAMSGTYSVVLTGSLVLTTKLDAIVNGSVVDCVAVTGAGTYSLSITASETDNVVIAVDSGSC